MLQKEELSFGHAKVLASVKEDEESYNFAAHLAVENQFQFENLRS